MDTTKQSIPEHALICKVSELRSDNGNTPLVIPFLQKAIDMCLSQSQDPYVFQLLIYFLSALLSEDLQAMRV